MNSPHNVDLDALTNRLLIRIQLLRFRTQRLRGWRALHGQIIKSRLPGGRLFSPKTVHRSVIIEVTSESEPLPIWVN